MPYSKSAFLVGLSLLAMGGCAHRHQPILARGGGAFNRIASVVSGHAPSRFTGKERVAAKHHVCSACLQKKKADQALASKHQEPTNSQSPMGTAVQSSYESNRRLIEEEPYYTPSDIQENLKRASGEDAWVQAPERSSDLAPSLPLLPATSAPTVQAIKPLADASGSQSEPKPQTESDSSRQDRFPVDESVAVFEPVAKTAKEPEDHFHHAAPFVESVPIPDQSDRPGNFPIPQRDESKVAGHVTVPALTMHVPSQVVSPGTDDSEIVLRVRPGDRSRFLDEVTRGAELAYESGDHCFSPLPPLPSTTFRPLPPIANDQAIQEDNRSDDTQEPVDLTDQRLVPVLDEASQIIAYKVVSQDELPERQTVSARQMVPTSAPMKFASSKKMVPIEPRESDFSYDPFSPIPSSNDNGFPQPESENVRLRAKWGDEARAKRAPLATIRVLEEDSHWKGSPIEVPYSYPKPIELESLPNAPVRDHVNVADAIRRLTVRSHQESEPSRATIDR